MSAACRNPNILATVASLDDHRRAGRFRVKSLKAAHGRVQGGVVDLSGTGARLSMSSPPAAKPGEPTMVTLSLGDATVTVKAQLVWVKPVSRKECLVGVRFDALNPSETAAIQNLARLGRDSLRQETRGG